MSAQCTCFGLLPDSWLAEKVFQGKIQIITPARALAFECAGGKGTEVSDELKGILIAEKQIIDRMPQVGSAIRCDKAERLHAEECGASARKTVDVCVATAQGLLLVECKYRARPETALFYSAEHFDNQVMEKFRSTQKLWAPQTEKPIRSESIVLFNSASIEKVLSMFYRLRLEDDARKLFSDVHVIGTEDFFRLIINDLV